jgi:hypothetical protein
MVKQIFFKTGEPIFGDEARQLVASLLHGIQPGLVAALMNYHLDTGKTITGFPHVHFFGTKQGFGLNGFGETGKKILEDVEPLIHQSLCRRLDRIIQIKSQEMTSALEKRPYPIRYRVGRMIVQKKASHTKRMEDAAKGSSHLENLFLNSIMRQAETLKLPFPQGVSVKFLGAERTFTAKSKKHSQAMLGIVGAEFEVNLRMTGIWSVGYLLSKGYGSFNANMELGLARKAMAEDFA